MSLRSRLQRLERSLMPEGGCPACCERRGRMIGLAARQLPDGSVVAEEEGPPPCSRCGQVPEQILLLIETLVEARPGSS
jgi:hypothetical protein